MKGPVIKMADEPSSPQLIPECISKPVKSLLTPPAKEIGMTFADLIYLATGRLHFKVAKQQAQYDHDLQEFKDGLDKKSATNLKRLYATPSFRSRDQRLKLLSTACMSLKFVRCSKI